MICVISWARVYTVASQQSIYVGFNHGAGHADFTDEEHRYFSALGTHLKIMRINITWACLRPAPSSRLTEKTDEERQQGLVRMLISLPSPAVLA